MTHLDFLNLLLETTNVRITFCRRLFQLHHVDHGISVIGKNTDNSMTLVVQENAASGLKEILVDKGHDGHIVFPSTRGGNDGVVVVDDLFQRTDHHGRASKLVNLAAIFGISILYRGANLGRQTGLVGDEF
jgi:hypothetical protein